MSSDGTPPAFGRFEILGKLGSGGMGQVLEARDRVLGRRVAIKLLSPRMGSQPALRERFRREALALARLTHPNIVRIFDVGEEGDRLYYIMEMLQGSMLPEGDPSPPENRPPQFAIREFLSVFTPLAEALAHVHESGLIHRDIKPANILIGVPERGPVLTDFGLAWMEGIEQLTGTGVVMGTLRYMAPEQARGSRPDALCDLYGLGACMFGYSTGVLPFSELRAHELLFARARTELPPVRSLAPHVPESLAEVIDRCVRLQPAERFGSTRQLAEELRRLPAARTPRVATLSLGPAGRAAAELNRLEDRHDFQTGMGGLRIPPCLVIGFVLLLLVVVVYFWQRQSAASMAAFPSRVPTGPVLALQEASAAAAASAKSFPSVDTDATPGVPVSLTAGFDRGRRVALATLEDRLLAVWVRPGGQLGMMLGEERGRRWRRPPADDMLRAHPHSEVAVLGQGRRFSVLFCAADRAGEPTVFASTSDSAVESWTAPVELGKLAGPGDRLRLVGRPGALANEPILAVWESARPPSPSLAWGQPDSGEWSAAAAPPGGQRASHFTALLPRQGGAVAIWQHDDSARDFRTLMTSTCPRPGAPWSASASLPLKTDGYDPSWPAGLASGDSLYLQWSENQVPAHPLVLGISDDGGKTFQKVGCILRPYSKDPFTGLVGQGSRLWSVFALALPDRLAWASSVDGGRSWSPPLAVGPLTGPRAPPALVVTPGGDAWLLWSDEAMSVRVVRLLQPRAAADRRPVEPPRQPEAAHSK